MGKNEVGSGAGKGDLGFLVKKSTFQNPFFDADYLRVSVCLYELNSMVHTGFLVVLFSYNSLLFSNYRGRDFQVIVSTLATRHFERNGSTIILKEIEDLNKITPKFTT